jgi:hypothetical protein
MKGIICLHIACPGIIPKEPGSGKQHDMTGLRSE